MMRLLSFAIPAELLVSAALLLAILLIANKDPIT